MLIIPYIMIYVLHECIYRWKLSGGGEWSCSGYVDAPGMEIGMNMGGNVGFLFKKCFKNINNATKDFIFEKKKTSFVLTIRSFCNT